MDGQDGAGPVLEAVQVQPSVVAGSGAGWGWSSDAVTYGEDGLGVTDEWSIPALMLTAHAEASDEHAASSPWAAFSFVGRFGTDGRMVMAGCHLVCTGQDGWGPRFTVRLTAQALPTAVGTAADPHLRFHCRTEIGTGAVVACSTNLLLDVDHHGVLEVVTYDFDWGDARVLTTPFFQLHYESPAGGLDSSQ